MTRNYFKKCFSSCTALLLFLCTTTTAQSITYTVTGSLCAGSHTLTLSGTANGKNTYSGSILGYTATIAWNGSTWAITAPATAGVLFTNNSETASNPPCHTVGTFVALGACAGATVTASSGACAVSTIPIELVNFTANTRTNWVELAWLTASETNNKGFQIERSDDGFYFSALDFVKSKGDSKGFVNYTFVDQTALTGINYYYRLRQMDRDGTESLSKVIGVKTSQKDKMYFTPNPANNELTLHFSSENATIQVYDLLGRLVLDKKSVKTGNTTLDISSLKTGNYIVEMQVNGGVSREKLIKY
ncbi:MAG: T9SS type A sorting domain-containing protein [Saprospiraceae bacterium]|nr:T9SS type A sorting domain-containing protein [Saprospiraceae bacterium]